MMNNLWHDCLLGSIEREFIEEHCHALKEFKDRSNELTETLITELNERKTTIKLDNLNMELSISYKYIFNHFNYNYELF